MVCVQEIDTEKDLHKMNAVAQENLSTWPDTSEYSNNDIFS